MNIQVLVTTMQEKDISKFNTMNIQTDVVFANQTENYGYISEEKDGCIAELISTATRGTSRNRNIAITCSSENADILVFSDDDLVFFDGYEKIIADEFLLHPNAEAIKFNIENKGTRKIAMSPISSFKRANIKNVSNCGVCAMAIKRNVLLNKNLFFNERFGPGTENFCGEDTIFLQNLIKKKVKFYLSPKYIADIYQDDSTWFEGYTAKYFTVIGKVLATIYPKLCRLIVIRSAYKFSKRPKCSLNFWEILSSYNKGINEQKKK